MIVALTIMLIPTAFAANNATVVNLNNVTPACSTLAANNVQPSIIGNNAAPNSLALGNNNAAAKTTSELFPTIATTKGGGAGYDSGYSIIGRGTSARRNSPLALGHVTGDGNSNSQVAPNNPQQTVAFSLGNNAYTDYGDFIIATPSNTTTYTALVATNALLNNSANPNSISATATTLMKSANIVGYVTTQEVVNTGGTSKVANHGHVNSVNRNNTQTGMKH